MTATTSMMRKGVGVSAVTETPSDIGWRRTALVWAGCLPAAEAARLVLQSEGNDLNDERAAHEILARSYTALGDTANAAREQAWIDAHPKL